MPLTKKLLNEIAADMAAEQAYYKELHTLIECAKHTGAPIPQVRPFPGRNRVAGAWVASEPTAVTALPAREAAAAGPAHSRQGGWNGTSARRGWARSCLGSMRQAFGRLLHPVRHNGPVL